MKKLIAIAVMIALVAGAVFAETRVSGSVDTRMTLFTGGKDIDAEMKGGGGFGSFKLSGTNDDGTLGGALRLKVEDTVRNPQGNTAGGASQVYVWWKPIDQLKIFLGGDNDGMFATDALEGWSFNQGADDYMTYQGWGYWRDIYPGNWDQYGLAFSFYLVDGLDINLIFHTHNSAAYEGISTADSTEGFLLEEILGFTQLNASFAFDYGKIFFNWMGPKASFDTDKFGQIGLSYLMTGVVDGLQLHAGFSTQLEKDGNNPILLGLSAYFDSGDFGIKFRSGYTIATGDNDGVAIHVNVMPYYNLGSLIAFFNIGLTMDNDGSETGMGFFLNPYIKVPVSGGQFRVGMILSKNISGQGDPQKLDAGGKDALSDAPIKVKIPMLFTFGF